MKVQVIDIESEVKNTVGMLRNAPDFNEKLPIKVSVGLDGDDLTIVFGPDDEKDEHIHDALLRQATGGRKFSVKGGSKINLRNQGDQVVADWTRNRSQSLGPMPEELKETVIRELQAAFLS